MPSEKPATPAAHDVASHASIAARGLAVVALIAALSLAWRAVVVVRQDLLFTAAATEVGFWGRGAYQPEEPVRQRTGQHLDLLLAKSPSHPDYLTLAASYYAWQAYWAPAPELEQHYNHRALAAQYAAQQYRPAYRQGWATMLGYAARADGGAEQGALARRRMSALHGGAVPAPAGDLGH